MDMRYKLSLIGLGRFPTFLKWSFTRNQQILSFCLSYSTLVSVLVSVRASYAQSVNITICFKWSSHVVVR
jgi:hypothetical protein